MKKLSLLFVILFFVDCKNTTVQKTEMTTAPNIIFIVASDQGYGGLRVNGQTHFETPNLDRLMTGQHTGHTFIRGNYERSFTLKKEG